jgi:hypothetical protein
VGWVLRSPGRVRRTHQRLERRGSACRRPRRHHGERVRIVSADGAPVPGAAVTVEVDYPDGTTARVTGRTRPTGIAVVRRHVTQTGTYTFTIFNAGWVPSGGRAAPTSNS